MKPRIGNLCGVEVADKRGVSIPRGVVPGSKLGLVSLAFCKVVLWLSPTLVQLVFVPVCKEKIIFLAEQGRVGCMFFAKLFKVSQKARIILRPADPIFR